ncbi:MAG: RNA methyltransferase [Kiritimatiellaeota bacterium]|nr:RNA methyltransferase [Kiritimatiellota bacterium]
MTSAGDHGDPPTRRERRIVADALTRHGRRKTGLFVVEGLRCCREAFRHCPGAIQLTILSATFAESAKGMDVLRTSQRTAGPVRIVSDAQFAALAKTRSPQGLLCVLLRAALHAPRALVPGIAGPLVLVLDRIGDPGNLGTMLRTAWAVGLPEVWLTEGTTDAFGPKAIRAGMGAQFSLGLREFPDLGAVRDALGPAGLRVLWLAAPRGGTSCFSPEFELRESALVIGNEATGVRTCAGSRQVTIPMPGGAESLNAAQAATVLLFEAVRRGLLRAMDMGTGGGLQRNSL